MSIDKYFISRISFEVLSKHRAERWLVFCDQARPLLKHEAERLDDHRRVADGKVEGVAQLRNKEERSIYIYIYIYTYIYVYIHICVCV